MAKEAPPLHTRDSAELRANMTSTAAEREHDWHSGNGEPGTALLETVARMTELLATQLNQMPRKNVAEVLAGLGTHPIPMSAARGTVTFTPASVRNNGLRVPAGTQVTTQVSGDSSPIRFSTTAPADLSPVTLGAWGFLREGEASKVGRSGDIPILELSRAAPGEFIVVDLALRLDTRLGFALLAEAEEWEWEVSALDGGEPIWLPCGKMTGLSGPSNSSKPSVYSVGLRLPHHHHAVSSPLRAAGRVGASPAAALLRIRSVSGPASTAMEIRGVLAMPEAPVVHGVLVPEVYLGPSSGETDQRFPLTAPPQPESWPLTLRVITDAATTTWTYVANLTDSGPRDQHFTLDPSDGAILLAPLVSYEGGSRRHGAVPPVGARLRLDPYITGGGSEGNLPEGSLTVLPVPVPGVNAVTNSQPCVGGADGETDDLAARRDPTGAVNPDRAVTAGDYEDVVRHVAADVARARVLPVPVNAGETTNRSVTVRDARPATVDLTFSLAGAASRSGDVTVPAGTTVWPELKPDGPAVPFTTDHDLALRVAAGHSVLSVIGPGPWHAPDSEPQDSSPGNGSITFITAIPRNLPLAEAVLALELEGDPTVAPPHLAVSIHHVAGTPTRLTSRGDNATVLPMIGQGGRHVCALRLKDSSGWSAASRRPPALTAVEALPQEEHLAALGFPFDATAWLTCTMTPRTSEPSEAVTAPSPIVRLIRVAFCRASATVGAHQCQTVPTGTPLLPASDDAPTRLPAWPVWGSPPTITAYTDEAVRTWAPVIGVVPMPWGPEDVLIDSGTGIISFGKQIHYSDGMVRQLGATKTAPRSEPRTGREYRTTQGSLGNLPATVLTLHTLDVSGLTVVNPGPARGGADAVIESREEVVPDVEILVLPHAAADALGQLNPEHLKPSSELDARIKAGLAPIRPPALNIGVRPFD
ncbi:baseplate J/gp47 family protein, partial [Streptomyces sp. H27-G5]